MSFITSVGVAVPSHKIEQSTIAIFMQSLAKSEEQHRKIKTVFRASGIQTRYSVLEDYGKQNNFSFFPNSDGLEPFPGTQERMEAYRNYAVDLSLAAIEDCRKNHLFDISKVTHLITVSCTGMYAPGLDIDIVTRLGLKSSISRTCINFMGCFAAISGIKTANAYCEADPTAKVLLVCTELCSLHFQKDFTDDNILANALFADGAAAMIIQANPYSGQPVFIESFYHDIAINGASHMAWSIGNLGFNMRLSSYVPDVLSKAIEDLFQNLLSTVHLNNDDVAWYAVHPGGKKILDEVGVKLGIDKPRLQFSYDVLHNYGNMSSPTILFVLQQILNSGNVKAGDQIAGMAFGPGITMESMMLKVM